MTSILETQLEEKTIVWLVKFGEIWYNKVSEILYSKRDPYMNGGCIIYDILLQQLSLKFRNIVQCTLTFLIQIMQHNTIP